MSAAVSHAPITTTTMPLNHPGGGGDGESPTSSSVQSASSATPPPGYLYGAVCRIDFWARMTSALGFTQIAIGSCCVLFYMTVIIGDLIVLPLSSIGLTTGLVVSEREEKEV